MSSKFCQYCGVQLLGDARFCGSCGKPQWDAASASSPTPATSPAAATPVTPAPGAETTSPYFQPPKKPAVSKPILFVAIGVAAALVIAAIFLFTSRGPSLSGKSASEIMDQTLADEMCLIEEPRSELLDYDMLLADYDDDKLRYCDEGIKGVYFVIRANQSASEMADYVSAEDEDDYVLGDDWVIEFWFNDDDSIVDDFANKYGGEPNYNVYSG
jgi:hypothetical protein